MGCSSAAAHMRTARRSAMRAAHIWSAVRMHGAQLSRSTYAHCAPRRSALPCGQNGSCRRHMLCPLCAQHSMLHALRPMRVALHICAPIYLVCCAACMRHGTMCCMPLQVRSAALRRIYMQRTKARYPSIPSKKMTPTLKIDVTSAPLPHETTVSILFRRPAEN